MESGLSGRSAQEVLDDHLRCREAADVEADTERNYARGVTIFTAKGAFEVTTLFEL